MSSVRLDSSHPQYDQAINEMRSNARTQTIGKILAAAGSVTLVSLVALGGLASLKAHLFLAATGGALALEGGGLMIYSAIRRNSIKNKFGITNEEQNMKYGINDFVNECVHNAKRVLTFKNNARSEE